MSHSPSIQIEYQVADADLASEIGLSPEDNFPKVLSTPRLIALMEVASARLMQPMLLKGELSVGVNVNVQHLAATPNKTVIFITSKYQGLHGKFHKFKVEAHNGGEVIGKGTHTRAITKASRLQF
ncbi:MAG: thioesterase family protein [Akkermansiaceae bacterium]